MQALHTAYQETSGDCPETIAKDREEADIIGGIISDDSFVYWWSYRQCDIVKIVMFVCDDDIIEKFAINHSEDNCQGHRADIKDVKTFVGW